MSLSSSLSTTQGLPLSVFEIWRMREAVDTDYQLLATTPSSQRVYYHVLVTDTGVVGFYKLRYVNGAVVGPFSEEYSVDT